MPGTSHGPASTGKPGEMGDGASVIHGKAGEGWGRLRQPLVLRLPPGYAVLIGVGVVILLVVAFSAGYSQGQSKANQRWQAMSEAEQGVASKVAPRGGTAASGGASANGSPSPGASANQGMAAAPVPGAERVFDDPALDPRKPGYQYYIIAHCSREEAQRLVAFMQERGRVEAAAVLLHNRPQYVVFVLVPFTREQTTSPEARDLKLKIFELGKVWASRTYRGPTNLSDTYMALYNPRPN